MKIAAAAFSALVALASVSAQEAATPLAQQTPLFLEEPSRALRSEDAAEATRALQAKPAAGPKITPGQVGDLALATFTIIQAFAPLVGSGGKNCHQLACWVASNNEACGMIGANQAQRELIKGRNSFGVEGVNPQGMWVRFWRTQYSPPDRGDVADGTCTDGSKFTVTNCMGTGKVHC